MNKYKALKRSRQIVLILLFLFRFTSSHSQEIGYNMGVNKIGINPGLMQPVYGFSIGYIFTKYIALETNMFYSQRTIDKTAQADYLSFVGMPKFGYFGKKAGFYFAPAFLLNPCLYHSNIENHTYISTWQSIGAQLSLRPALIADIKIGYDLGLSGAYFENGIYKKYSGPLVLLGLKVSINRKEF